MKKEIKENMVVLTSFLVLSLLILIPSITVIFTGCNLGWISIGMTIYSQGEVSATASGDDSTAKRHYDSYYQLKDERNDLVNSSNSLVSLCASGDELVQLLLGAAAIAGIVLVIGFWYKRRRRVASILRQARAYYFG